MRKKSRMALATATAAALISPLSNAATVSWTDWTSSAPGVVNGTLDVGGTSVGVTFTGTYTFAQTTGGTNYWNPQAPYLSATVGNAPPAADIVALNMGGTATITFSQAVTNPLLALVSWNGNTVDFGVPINLLSNGAGYWGSGTPVLNAAGTGFFGQGEVHGVFELPGTYTSITFTHTSENWHGLTAGVLGLATPPVPEPATYVLMGLGLLGVAAARRRSR